MIIAPNATAQTSSTSEAVLTVVKLDCTSTRRNSDVSIAGEWCVSVLRAAGHAGVNHAHWTT